MTSPEHPLDQLVTDPTGRPPLCDEPEFAAMLSAMAADVAPRLFAVVQEYGERVDAKIVAWGMAFGEHVDVIGEDVRATFDTPEAALPVFHFGTHLRARLVWPAAAVATPG